MRSSLLSAGDTEKLAQRITHGEDVCMKNKQPAGLSCRPSWAGVAVFLVLFSIAMAYAEHTASTEFLKGYHGSGNQHAAG
jgi:hypothetical protein